MGPRTLALEVEGNNNLMVQYGETDRVDLPIGGQAKGPIRPKEGSSGPLSVLAETIWGYATALTAAG